VIVVATADFEVYHEVVTELRARGVRFTTVEPGEVLPTNAEVLITAPDDEFEIHVEDEKDEGDAEDPAIPEQVVASEDDHRRAVDEALSVLRASDGRTVIGVDPGDRPGIAVCAGDIVVAAFQVSLTEAPTVIRREATNASDPVIRVGDGARLQGQSIIDGLNGLPVELVNETGTTPSLGSGARGMGDVLAAANIARLPGDRATERELEPTAGELERIKRRSREQSGGNRTIDEELARRVASGELTVDEALVEHRER
jgi:hypothetical protein